MPPSCTCSSTASAPRADGRAREAPQGALTRGFKRSTDEELRAVLTLSAGPGVVLELVFGSWVLFRPERINACARASDLT